MLNSGSPGRWKLARRLAWHPAAGEQDSSRLLEFNPLDAVGWAVAGNPDGLHALSRRARLPMLPRMVVGHIPRSGGFVDGRSGPGASPSELIHTRPG